MRFWSAVAPAGRMPGTTSTPSGPVSARSAATSSRRADKAANPRLQSHLCQQTPPVRRVRVHSGRSQLRGIHAGQHGNGQQLRRVGHALQRRAAPRPASPVLRGVNRHHPHAQRRGRAHGSGHGVGNVVKLQVEKDRVAARHQRLHHGRAGGGKQLQPHLEPLAAPSSRFTSSAAAAALGTSSATISRLRASVHLVRARADGRTRRSDSAVQGWAYFDPNGLRSSGQEVGLRSDTPRHDSSALAATRTAPLCLPGDT